MRVVTFTSDFGLTDEFVGICHAVIARIAPGVRVIDLTHGIPFTDRRVREAAAILAQSVPFAPADAVHLAVVDPGVGTGRFGIAIRATSGALLVGPDNGVLVGAAEVLGGIEMVHRLEEPAYRLEPASRTFHGRDVFAPAAAHLALGVPLEDLGPPLDPRELVRLPVPRVEVGSGRLEAEVLRTDRFGNVQLAASSADLDAAGLEGRIVVEAEGTGDRPVVRSGRRVSTFGDLDPGAFGVLVDSAGHAAVVCNGGDAAAELGFPSRVTLSADGAD